MKSAFLVAQPDNLGKYDAVFESHEVFLTSFDAAATPSLTGFITRNPMVAQQDYIIIDVGNMKTWSISHILSAVQHLRRFTAARLVFIGKACTDLTELYGTLASVHRVDNLITDRGEASTIEELHRAIAGDMVLADKMVAITKMLEQQTAQVTKPLYIPPGLVISVAVAGTMPRCGVTTQLFALYHYLKSLGFHPAILDSSGKLISLLEEYEKFERAGDGTVLINEINFCTREAPIFNAYLADYEVLSQEKTQNFCAADMSVLVGGTKPWELAALGSAIQELFGRPCKHLVTLANFSTEEDLKKLTKHLGKHYGLAPIVESIWKPPVNAAAYYGETILPVLKDICGTTTHRPAPDLEVG